jgi:hypothetical protein
VHGDIGENIFKGGFCTRIKTPALHDLMLSSWSDLISALVKRAWIVGSWEPEGTSDPFRDLLRLVETESLADHLVTVIENLDSYMIYTDDGNRAIQHREIGRCTGCDARTLYQHGYRISSESLGIVTEAYARDELERCMSQGNPAILRGD